MPYVYSTLTADQVYPVYERGRDPKQLPKETKRFFVNGLCNVLNPKTMMTPRGAVTQFTAEELKELEKIGAFQRHKEAGYLTVETTREDPAKVAKNMTAKDASAQLTDSDFEDGKEPKTNK